MMSIQASRYLAALFCFASITVAYTQDSSFKPVGQQIPAPSCLTVHGLWEPVCDQKTHGAWLKDVRHWAIVFARPRSRTALSVISIVSRPGGKPASSAASRNRLGKLVDPATGKATG
jgi:hypothetical protein